MGHTKGTISTFKTITLTILKYANTIWSTIVSKFNMKNKSPLLQNYLHVVSPDAYMPQCPLCLTQTHDTNHQFNCSKVPTQHPPTSL